MFAAYRFREGISQCAGLPVTWWRRGALALQVSAIIALRAGTCVTRIGTHQGVYHELTGLRPRLK